MRDIPENLDEMLQSGATKLCRCWLVRRRDAVELGFTDHDRDLTFDNIVFRANSGMSASTIEASTGLSVDNAQAVGALMSDTISEEDIIAGKFDGAEVFHWLVSWENPSENLLLFRGTLGEMRRGDGVFEVELRGVAEELNRPIGRSYMRESDCRIEGGKCGIELDDPDFTATAPVSGVEGYRAVTFGGLSAFAENWFVDGSVVWEDGTVSLIKTDVTTSEGRLFGLWEDRRTPTQIGEMARVVAGSARRAAEHKRKFGDLLNFRGFPHMPGEDFVTAYPTKDELHDGQSRTGLTGAFDIDPFDILGEGNA